uniref:Uncharacterized protein n=1 Tax=Rhizophagus irregularis (strain DAOM 181602 / DAOM 197198 / MUCL 43194) TaxID=747089 RepID=U9T8N9_RHIID
MGGKNGDGYYEDALSRGILQTMVVFDTKKNRKDLLIRLYSDSEYIDDLGEQKVSGYD